MYVPDRMWTAKLDCHFDRASVWEGSKQIAEVYGACHQDREDISNMLAATPALVCACQMALNALKRIPEPDEAEGLTIEQITMALNQAKGMA